MSKKKKKPSAKLKTSSNIWKIEWEDHASLTGLWTSDVKPRGIHITSVGFKVYEDKKNVVLALNSSDQEEGRVSDMINIVKSCIRKQRRLK